MWDTLAYLESHLKTAAARQRAVEMEELVEAVLGVGIVDLTVKHRQWCLLSQSSITESRQLVLLINLSDFISFSIDFLQ